VLEPAVLRARVAADIAQLIDRLGTQEVSSR
jgi:hypothetical protein